MGKSEQIPDESVESVGTTSDQPDVEQLTIDDLSGADALLAEARERAESSKGGLVKGTVLTHIEKMEGSIRDLKKEIEARGGSIPAADVDESAAEVIRNSGAESAADILERLDNWLGR